MAERCRHARRGRTVAAAQAGRHSRRRLVVSRWAPVRHPGLRHQPQSVRRIRQSSPIARRRSRLSSGAPSSRVVLAEVLVGARRRARAARARRALRVCWRAGDGWRPRRRARRSSAKRRPAASAGITAGIADDGALLVRVGNVVERVIAGEIVWNGQMARRHASCAIDVGNTNIVLGVFDGTQLTQSWRLQTLRERTADEIGILVTQLFAAEPGSTRPRIDGIILSSVVPPLTGTMEEMAERYFGMTPLTVDPATNTGMPVLYVPAVRRRRRSRRQRGRRLRNVRAARSCPDHRRRFRHGDDVRRHFCGRGVHRRRHLPGHRHLGGRAVSARGTAAARRCAQAAVDHRTDDGDVDAGGTVLRLRLDGRWHRHADARRAARRVSARSVLRPAAWRACSRMRRRRSSASSRI